MYSDDEIDAAVQRYLLSDLAVTTTRLGSKDTLAAKRQVYDLITTSFLLRPASFFSAVWLASNKLRGLVAQQLTALQKIAEAAPRVSVPSQRVESVAELVNAEAAIADLTGALASRANGLNGLVGPGVERFKNSVERFIRTELTKNVVSGSEVVATGEELRTQVATIWAEARDRYTEILTLAASIQAALTNYGATRLPATALQGVVQKIQARIQSLQQEMAATTAPRDSRTAMLDLLAARTLLQRAANFRAPVTVLMPLAGDPATGTLGGTTGEVPSILGTVSGPWEYVGTPTLSLTVNGGTPVAVVLPAMLDATQPVTAEHVIAAIGGSTAELRASVVRTQLLRANASCGAGTVLDYRLFSATDLEADGTEVVRAAGHDFAALGVQAGMQIRIATTNTYDIVSVNGSELVLDDATTVGSGLSYEIAPKPTASITAGARVELAGITPDNPSWTYVVSSTFGTITVVDTLVADDAVQISVTTEYLKLEAKAVATDSGIAAVASAGATALGFAPAAEAVSSLGTLTIGSGDFLARGVGVGDHLDLLAPGTTQYAATITAVGPRSITFSPAVPYEAGAWTYEIQSTEAAAYDELSAELAVAEAGTPDFSALEYVMQRLSAGSQYTTVLQLPIATYLATLQAEIEALDAYVVPRDAGVERAVRLMQEHGFDRALDLFVELQFSSFFNMQDDEVSYSTWVVRKSADVTRQVAPVTKGRPRTGGQIRTLATQSTTFDPRASRDKE